MQVLLLFTAYSSTVVLQHRRGVCACVRACHIYIQYYILKPSARCFFQPSSCVVSNRIFYYIVVQTTTKPLESQSSGVGFFFFTIHHPRLGRWCIVCVNYVFNARATLYVRSSKTASSSYYYISTLDPVFD